VKRIRPSPPNGDRRTNAASWVTGTADALAGEQLDVVVAGDDDHLAEVVDRRLAQLAPQREGIGDRVRLR